MIVATLDKDRGECPGLFLQELRRAFRNPSYKLLLKEMRMKGIVALVAAALVLGGVAQASKKAPDKKPVIYTLGLTGAK